MDRKQPKYNLLSLLPVLLLIMMICLCHAGRAYAQQKDEAILAGVPANFPPHYSIDAQTGKPTGFAIDVMDEVARRSGIKVRYVVYLTWPQTVEAMEKGEVVLIPNMGIIAERAALMDFTSPIETFHIVIFVRDTTRDIKGVADLIGKEVAVVETNSGLSLMKQRGGSKLQIYPSPDEAFLSLISGKSDALVYPEPSIKMLSQKTGLEDRIKIVGEPLLEVKRGIAVRKDDQGLLKKLDDEVRIFTKSPRYAEIYAKWYGKPEPYWTAGRVAVFGGGFLALVIVSLTVWRYFSLLKLNIELKTTVEERKKAEDALRVGEERFRAIASNTPDHILIQDRQLRYTFVANPQLGLTEQDMLGKTDYDFLTEEEAEKLTRIKTRVLESGQPVHIETSLISKEGKAEYYDGAYVPKFDIQSKVDGLIGYFKNVTERKRAEEELGNSKVFLDSIIEHSPYAMWISDDKGILIRLNQACRDLLHITDDEVIGKYNVLQDNIVKEQGLLPTVRKVFEKGETVNFGLKYDSSLLKHLELKKSALLILDVTISPVLDACGRVTNAIIQHIDITERKQAEEELQKYREHLEDLVKERTIELEEAQKALVNIVEDLNEKSVALARAMEQAQSADRLKSTFLATMSHELRTPLNSIMGFTGIVLQGMSGPLNEEQAKQLGMVQSSADHLLALINDVLDISKIEAGQVEILRRSFDMRPVIEQALRTVTPLAAKKGLSLDCAIVSDVGVLISDQRRVAQILINLVNNAVKFTEQGAVRIECRINEGRLETCVRDTGIGIKPEDMDKIFKPFSQVETSLARSHEGTGLGLSICGKLVGMLGGTIRAESEWGKGSAFTFTLPLS